MTKDHNFKKRVRARCARTGEPYSVARRALLAERGETADNVTGGTMPPLEQGDGDTVPVFISPSETADEAHDFSDEELRWFLRLLLGEEGIPLDEDTSRRVGILPPEEGSDDTHG